MEFPETASIPPIEGEYAYFDHRVNGLKNKSEIQFWFVSCDNKNEILRQAHYSLPYEDNSQLIVSCNGRICSIKHEADKPGIVQDIWNYVFAYLH